MSGWSKDPSTKVGAVLVMPDRTVLSVGYNGFPAGMADGEERLGSRDEKYARMIHGEVNCLLTSRGLARGCTLYTWPFAPCHRCAVQLIQAGVSRVVFPQASADEEERWNFRQTKEYLDECGVTWLQLPGLRYLDGLWAALDTDARRVLLAQRVNKRRPRGSRGP